MKSNVALIFCLTLTVFALGCVTPEQPITTTLPPATIKVLPTVETLPPAVQAEVNTLRTAINTNKSDDCDKVEPNLKDLCYRQLGMKNNDPGLCVKITNTQQKDMCLVRVAVAKKDKSICAQVTEPESRRGCEARSST